METPKLGISRRTSIRFRAPIFLISSAVTTEAIAAKRAAAEQAGGGWRYDRTCVALAPEDVARKLMQVAVRKQIRSAGRRPGWRRARCRAGGE